MPDIETVTLPNDAMHGDAGKTSEQPAQPAAPERPAWLPEKFKSAEDLAKAYGELENKMGAQPKPAESPAPAAENTPQPATTLDFAPFEQELKTAGNLSDDSFKKLENMGIPRSISEAYVKGLIAQADQSSQAFYEAVGGKEPYGQMMAWAETSLPKAELQAFLETPYPSMEAAKAAVQGLFARYQANAEPSLVQGSTGAGSSGYASQAQMLEDMTNPKYKKDPAFRAQVEQKIKASPWFPR